MYLIVMFLFIGSSLSLWTGVDASSQDYVALLMCIAVGGYHSVASYQWSKDGLEMEEEVYPLIYTAAAGKYSCNVTTAGMSMEHHFEVTGNYSVGY